MIMSYLIDLLDELGAALLIFCGYLITTGRTRRNRLQKDVASTWCDAGWDRAPFGIALVDMDTGEWLRVNQELENITGYTSQELCNGKTWMDLTTEDTLCADMQEVERVKRGEQSRYSMYKSYDPKVGPWGESDPVPCRITVTVASVEGRSVFLTFVQDLRHQESKYAAAKRDIALLREERDRLRASLAVERDALHSSCLSNVTEILWSTRAN